MELEHLTTFRAVARSGSFTAASGQLHYAQSTVSVHVRALETEVGAPLFDRLPAGVQLTEPGARLMELSERILDLAAAAASVADEGAQATGEVTMAAPETIVAHRLPAVLRYLKERHPELKVRLEPIPYQDIRSAVSSGQVDVGFLLQPPLQPTSSVAVRQLRTEPLLMVAAPDHPLAMAVDDVAEEFSRTTLFLTERGCGYRPILEAYLDSSGIRAGHTLEFNSVEAVRRCVEAGLGVALIPGAWLAASLESGALVPMDWFAPRFQISTQIAWHPLRWQGGPLSAVIEASEACIADTGSVSSGSAQGPTSSPASDPALRLRAT